MRLSPNHMELAALKVLVLRLVAHQVLRDSKEEIVHEVVREFCRIAGGQEGPDNSKKTLSQWLNSQRRQARRVMWEKRNAENVARIEECFRAIERHLRRASCFKCSQNSHLCGSKGASRKHDNAQVANHGHCIKVIHDIYQYLYGAVVCAVQDWAFNGDDAYCKEVEVMFTTDATPSEYEGPIADHIVDGSTLFRDAELDQGRASDVQLKFVTEQLDWQSILLMPWLLVHELTCHAFQGKAPQSDCRASAVACPFYEGWMDEVAANLFEWDLRFGFRAEQKAKPAFLLDYCDDIVSAAHGFRRRRFGDDRLPGVSVVSVAEQWRWGRGAARRALRFFEYAAGKRNPFSSETQRKRWAVRHLVRMSFQIQKCDPDDELIEDIIERVSDLCDYGRQYPSKVNKISSLLIQPIEDIEEWVSAITELVAEFQ